MQRYSKCAFVPSHFPCSLADITLASQVAGHVPCNRQSSGVIRPTLRVQWTIFLLHFKLLPLLSMAVRMPQKLRLWTEKIKTLVL